MHKNEAIEPSSSSTHTAMPSVRSRPMRWLVATVCFAVVLLATSVAMALDKDQIIQMTEMGLGEGAIMGAIDSADPLDLEEEDIDELEDQGVSEDVIDHLYRRGHVATDEEVVEEEPVDDDDDDGMIALPDDVDEDDVGDDFSDLTPEEQQERLDEMVQQEIEEREAEEQRQQEMESAAAQLSRADRIVEEGRNMEAARIYLAYLDFDPEHGSDDWYQATFGLAKALMQEGIYSGAATPLEEVLMEGTAREHFQEAFGMLETLTREINYQPPSLEELTQFYLGDTNERFQERFNYYMGKFFYDYNRMETALDYLSRIPEDAPEYPEARYLSGVAQLDDAVDDVPGALNNFETAIRAAEAAPEGEVGADILQLGYLALARVFFEVGFFDVALYYYEQIPSESARHAEAMFESAWSFFMKNDFERALGAFHSLHSPYYAGRYYPELYILEATAYLNMCNFDKSQRALEEFEDQYLAQRPALQEYLENTYEPEAYWDLMENAYREDTDAELPELFTNAVLENLSFYNIFQVVRALQEERASLERNIDSLGDFGEQVLENVEEQLEMNIEEAGIVVQQRLTEVDRELQEWETNAQQIQFDIQSEEQQEIQQRMQNPAYEGMEREDAGTTLMVVADDWQTWPFEGEYWLDEVDSYRSQMRTECIEP